MVFNAYWENKMLCTDVNQTEVWKVRNIKTYKQLLLVMFDTADFLSDQILSKIQAGQQYRSITDTLLKYT